MPSFDKKHLVRHKPKEMFDLVADVESYPQFLPLCEALIIRSKREKAGRVMLIADMTVAYKLLRETFTSQVLLKPEELAIDVQYLEGPFRYLENRWRFQPVEKPGGEALGEACEISFSIDYEFKSRALGLVMGTMFDYAFRKFTHAFEERADVVYGAANS